MRSQTACLLLSLASAVTVAALAGQSAAPVFPPAPAPPALRVEPGLITESRVLGSRGNSGSISVALQVSGEGLPAGTQLRQINVTRAVDGSGQTLASTGMQISGSSISGPGRSMQASVAFGSVARNIKTLKILEGTIELYVPAEANGSGVTIPDITKSNGPVAVPDPTKAGVLVQAYHDRASYDALCAAQGLDPSPLPKFPNTVGFYIRDPTGFFRGWVLQDASGRPIPGRSTSQRWNEATGVLINIELDTSPLTGTQLVILRSPPGSNQTVPFHLEDIPLP